MKVNSQMKLINRVIDQTYTITNRELSRTDSYIRSEVTRAFDPAIATSGMLIETDVQHNVPSTHEVTSNGCALRRQYSGKRFIVGVCLALFSALSHAAESHSLSELSAAALKNDVATMRELLRNGADPNASNSTGFTPLMVAANAPSETGATRTCQLEALKLLLDNKAKPNAKAQNGHTALMGAAASARVECVEGLLAAGADVNAQTSYKDTPLLEATNSGSLQIVAMLAKSGARLDDTDANGQTALMRAISQASFGSVEATPYEPIAEWLLHQGANPNVRDRNGRTALTLATGGDKTVVVYSLLDHHADINATDPTAADATPLIIASSNNNYPVVKVLLRYHPDLTRRDKFGYTAYGYAKSKKYDAIAELLEKAGAKQ